ncbi:phospholipase D family protein [Microcoleus sp. POL10_C6]|uniref:phospholipase D family protein n=1 Tax=Microcoleus sp. POL10_C6 TaxID=2818852 RepID=UPI002FD0BB5F
MMSFLFLYDNPEKLESEKDNLDTEIKFLLDSKKYSWDKIYLFSAFVKDDGVEQVKKILVHPSLNENTEVVIAIGQKDNFNDPSDIQKLLKFIDEESTKIKTKPVRFICPKNNFHIKAYCFLGRRVIDNRVIDNKEIGFSIIGSSNLTGFGLKCEGELCISIHHLNLTKELIYRLSNKYSNSTQWDQEIMEYEIKYNEKHSRKDQALITSTPPDGKFLKLGVTDDIALIDKGTNLVKGKEDIDWFHSYAHTTIEQAKEDFPERSLCLLLTENKMFKIVEIMPHSSDREKTEGCFVIYRKKVTYELSDDIRKIFEKKKEEYEKIKIAEEKYEEYIEERNQYPELEYATLNMFENEVKEYQKMLADPNYKKGLEKGEEKMQSKIEGLLELEIDYPISKERLKKLLQSI